MLNKIRNKVLCYAAFVTTAFSAGGLGVDTIGEQLPKVYIAGDSTACVYETDENYALPRAGWGMYLGNYLEDGVEVVDLALGGRSSKSFMAEENYKYIINNIKEGDYLIIQFGHNDAKNSKPEDIEQRYTNPEGDKETEGSFKYYLDTGYIEMAKKKGAIPILFSPVARRKFDKDGKITDSHGLYDDAVRELSKEIDVNFVDMTNITYDYYNEIGIEGSKLMHALYYDKEKGIDNSHFNHYGADIVAGMVAREISNMKTGLEKYIKDINFDNSADKVTRGYFDSLLSRLNSLDGTFEHDNTYLLRGEMFKMAGETLEKMGIELNKDLSTTTFKDLDELDNLCKGYAIGLAELGIIKGNGADKLMPNKAVDKKQCAAVIARMYDCLCDNENEKEQSIDELERVE